MKHSWRMIERGNGFARFTATLGALAMLLGMSAVAHAKGTGIRTRPPVPAGPGGSSGKPLPNPEKLEDPIIVTNEGAVLNGSFEVWLAGQAGGNFAPAQNVAGSNTFLFLPTGVAEGGLATFFTIFVDSVAANAVFGFDFAANGNTGPHAAIIGPATGLNVPFGITFGVTDGSPTLMWVTNGGTVVLPGPCAVGSVTAYEGITGNLTPFANSPVLTPAGLQNSTIGGCNTFMLVPVGISVDSFTGNIYVINGGLAATKKSPATNGFITTYNPGFEGFGDVFPLGGTLPGKPLLFPEYSALSLFGDTLYVTDIGDNSVKIFGITFPFGPFFPALTEKGSIVGPDTRLHTPMGIAVGLGGALIPSNSDDIYVANQQSNSVIMFDTEFVSLSIGSDFPPSTIIQGSSTLLNQPTGLAIDTVLDTFTDL